jgi:hypothetical protein
MDAKIFDWLITNLNINKEDSTSLFVTNEEGEKSLSENAIDTISDAFKAKMEKLKNDQYQRGIREKGKSIEKVLKQYDVSIDGKVEDVLKGHFDNYKIPVDKKLSDFEDSELFALPQVKNRLKSEFEKLDALQAEFDDYKKTSEKSKIIDSVRSSARKIFLDSNPVLSKDTKIRERQINAFLNSIPYDRISKDGESFKVSDAEGNQLQNDRYDDVSFNDFVMSHSFFETHEQDSNKTSTKVDTNYSKGDSSVPTFKTYKEVEAYIRTEKDSEKKKIAVENYKKFAAAN